MRYAVIKPVDTANGVGIRTSLFVQGCNFHCPGCFNEETWDFTGGKEWTKEIEDEFIKYGEPHYITGYSILGGEPLDPANIEDVTALCKRIKELHPDKTIWLYTGHYYGSFLTHEILNYIDIMVDGRFRSELKDLELRFRGSSNQRIIDIPRSIEAGAPVLSEIDRIEPLRITNRAR